jgi:RHS repeat-associated protein
VRKVVEKGGITEMRLYLGGFEIFRKKVGDNLELERETLHIMDDMRRIALVETLMVDNGVAVNNSTPVQRYQLSNNIESATLELDENANIISYEEYYPYGDTSYQAGRSASEVNQKRYRYTGKEKDEESGLYYHGARYYAAWLGRWTTVDPAGLVDGLNLYMYCRGDPIKFLDRNGKEATIFERFWPISGNVSADGIQTSSVVIEN